MMRLHGRIDAKQPSMAERVFSFRRSSRKVRLDPIGSYLGSLVDAHRDNQGIAVLAPLARWRQT
jgi:hypothetical protein